MLGRNCERYLIQHDGSIRLDVKMYHPGEMSDGDIEAAIATIMK
jgi:hypothetical protein